MSAAAISSFVQDILIVNKLFSGVYLNSSYFTSCASPPAPPVNYRWNVEKGLGLSDRGGPNAIHVPHKIILSFEYKLPHYEEPEANFANVIVFRKRPSSFGTTFMF
ncbi:hypothetical protein CBL_13311 [Carabus blaptoides fortunei]